MASKPRSRNDFRQEFLTCQLCPNQFDDDERAPKCLPCLHCFCRSCLRLHIAGKPDVNCPNCRKRFTVPKDGADGFVTNFNVENLRKYQNLHQDARALPENVDSHLCTSCDDGHAATGYCYECDAFVCQKCTAMHESMKALRSHEIEALEVLRKPEAQIKRRRTTDRCRDHNKAYSMFCKTCRKPICDTCGQIVAHNTHEKVDLNGAIEETVSVLKDLSNTVKNQKEPLERLSAMIETRVNDINTSFAKREEDINELFQQLERRLRERCSQAKEELQDRCQVLNKLLQEQKADVEAVLAQYDSACDFADQACENASPKQLFKHEEMVKHRLNELISETVSQTEPVANDYLEFNDDHFEAMDQAEDVFFSHIAGTRTSDTSASLCYPEVEIKTPIPSDTMQEVVIAAINFDGKPQRTGGDPFTAKIDSPDDREVPCNIYDNHDGTHRITFTASQPGTHHLDVRVFGRPIRGSPYPVNVLEDVASDGNTNQGVNVDIPEIALVGYVHKILVNISREDAEDATEEEAKADRIHATIETQTGDSVKCHIRNADRGQYAIEYTPPVDGLLNLNIAINDEPASGNPYSIHVQPASPKASKVWLGKPVANQLWSINISPRDYRQNAISIEDDALKCTVTNTKNQTEENVVGRRNKDGDLVFTTIPTTETYLVEAYMYNIQFVGKQIHVQEKMEIDLAKTSKSFPTGITSIGGETVFVSDTADGKIYCVTTDSNSDSHKESHIAVDMNKSSQITVDDQGRLLLLFPQTRMVHTIDQQGNELSRWPCQKKNSRPVTIVSSNNGRVIIADSKTPSMFIYKSDGELINTQELPDNSIKDGVNNICVDKRSNIILAHHSLPKIFTHNSDGQPRGQFASGATSCQLAVTCTHDDILLVAQLGTIRMIRFNDNTPSNIGEIPLVTGHIYTGLITTKDGCLIGLEVGYKRLVKYGYQIKNK